MTQLLTRFTALLAAGFLFLISVSPIEAVERCSAKVKRRDGTVLVFGKNVVGQLLWGETPAACSHTFVNEADCITPSGNARRCQLGAAGTPEGRTPPADCTVDLCDGAGTCEAYVTGCVPGTRSDDDPVDISARVTHSAVQSIPDATVTVLSFDSERWDSDNVHDTITNNSRLTAQTSGKYLICGHIRFDGNATGLRQVGIYKNANPIAIDTKPAVSTGGVPGCGSICPTDFSVCTHHELAANDYVELYVVQSSGGALNVLIGNSLENSDSDFEMVKAP